MKKSIQLCSVFVTVFLFGCASVQHEIITKNGAVTWDEGKLTMLEEYTPDQTQKLEKILGNNKIITNNTGVDHAGGPRVASTSVLDETNQLVVNNGGSNTGTMQDLIPTAAQAAIYGGAMVGAQSLANSAAESVARINANGNVQAAKNLKPSSTYFNNSDSNSNSGTNTNQQSQDQAQLQGQDQSQKAINAPKTTVSTTAYGGNAESTSKAGAIAGANAAAVAKPVIIGAPQVKPGHPHHPKPHPHHEAPKIKVNNSTHIVQKTIGIIEQ